MVKVGVAGIFSLPQHDFVGECYLYANPASPAVGDHEGCPIARPMSFVNKVQYGELFKISPKPGQDAPAFPTRGGMALPYLVDWVGWAA